MLSPSSHLLTVFMITDSSKLYPNESAQKNT